MPDPESAEGRNLEASEASDHCRNCGASAHDRFCAACGQRQRDLDFSLWEVLRQFVEEISSMDGRLPRTLSLLALRPGTLTARYLAGHRASFTPPLRLYLGASFAFFFVLHAHALDRSGVLRTRRRWSGHRV